MLRQIEELIGLHSIQRCRRIPARCLSRFYHYARTRRFVSYTHYAYKCSLIFNKKTHSIRSVVNIDACGTTGREILFQANSREMIEAYKQAPYPHGTVMVCNNFMQNVY